MISTTIVALAAMVSDGLMICDGQRVTVDVMDDNQSPAEAES